VDTAAPTRPTADPTSRVDGPDVASEGIDGQAFTATDRDALVRRLYAEDGGALLHFVTNLCAGDRYRAEDIVQETMLRAWRNAAALAGSGRPSLRPWLFTVARRLVIDAHRVRGARAEEVTSVPIEALPSADNPIATMLSREVVLAALAKLSPAQREALVCVHYLGMSVAETAAALGVPAGTIKSRTHYALTALRALLPVHELD
jgi:RNA polymerase sigma-70 factor (ECF subfamily)